MADIVGVRLKSAACILNETKVNKLISINFKGIAGKNRDKNLN